MGARAPKTGMTPGDLFFISQFQECGKHFDRTTVVVKRCQLKEELEKMKPYGMEEEDFLTSTGQVTYWIGLFQGQGGAPRWTDGSAPTDTKWDSNELHDNGTVPACMMMLHHGHWGNFSCKSESLAFFCEKWQSC
nr:C-type lectin domain family 4 member G [Odocoileus virginianus texanus]